MSNTDNTRESGAHRWYFRIILLLALLAAGYIVFSPNAYVPLREPAAATTTQN